MKLFEETIEREDIFSGRVVKLHRDRVLLENGKTSVREVIDHPGGVSVAVLTEENELLFVRQFRYPYHEVILELPAGKLEPGEDPFLAELAEKNGGTIPALGTICMYTHDSTGRNAILTGWLASQSDMLLEDWKIID